MWRRPRMVTADTKRPADRSLAAMPGGRGAFASARPQASPRAGRRCWADNARGERREAASRLRGRAHASQAWRRASLRDTYKAVTSPGAPPIPSGVGRDEGEKRKKNPEARMHRERRRLRCLTL